MKTFFSSLFVFILFCTIGYAQKKGEGLQKKGDDTQKVAIEVNHISPAEWNATFRSEGTSEVGRTVVTLSEDLGKIYVSYIDGNYQSHSCSKSLQKLTDYVYVTPNLTCGSASGYNAEITLEETITSYKLALIFRYCDGTQLKNVSKQLSISKSVTPGFK